MQKTLSFQILCSICLFILFSSSASTQSSPITIGQKHTITSSILGESRAFNVYLPHSYYSSEQIRFPVLYLMDGDYNFHYVSGMIEQLSMISEKIPEMIVVGISDNGHDSYVKNCTPENDDQFLQFIQQELKAYLDKHYKTSSYDILVGHSLGGLFVINTLLDQPISFDAYIAISPSLWYNDYKAEEQVEQFFKNNEGLNQQLYISLGDERGMGVLGFVNQMDIQIFADNYYGNEPIGLDYHFQRYPEENHNSVGLITIKDALAFFFPDYYLTENQLAEVSSFKDYEAYMMPYQEKIGSGFRLPPRQFRQIINTIAEEGETSLNSLKNTIKENYPASLGDFYHHAGNYYIKKEKEEKGLDLLKKGHEHNPNNLEFMVSIAEAYLQKKDQDQAKNWYQKALKLSQKQATSNWYINQLKANIKKVE
ncbi:MAG: hypothetical protein MI974_18935 [Chitinophagales bacterium]|nr:hypothetical protein [Chitinophagales bacterium]